MEMHMGIIAEGVGGGMWNMENVWRMHRGVHGETHGEAWGTHGEGTGNY